MSKGLHAGLNLCIFLEIYESEMRDVQVDGLLGGNAILLCYNSYLRLLAGHWHVNSSWAFDKSSFSS